MGDWAEARPSMLVLLLGVVGVWVGGDDGGGGDVVGLAIMAVDGIMIVVGIMTIMGLSALEVL